MNTNNKKNWQKTKIIHLIQKVIDNRGKSPPLSLNGKELIEIKSIENAKFPKYNLIKKFISNEIYNSWFRNGHPEKGDILVSTVGSVGEFAIMNENRGCIAQNIIAIRPKKNVNSNYLYYTLKSNSIKKYINSILMGAVQPSLKVPEFLDIDLYIPHIKEQEKISSILSSVDNLIEKTKSQINKLKEIYQSLLNNLLSNGITLKEFEDSELGKIPKGWKIKTLKELGKCIRGLTYSPKDISDKGLLVLRSSNIKDNEISLEDKVYVNLKIEKEYLTRISDILICVRNGSRNLIGKSAIINFNYENFTHGAFMTIYRSKYNNFLKYLFKSNQFYKYVSRDLGATINSINNSNLLKYKFAIPTEKEQQEIINIFSSIDNQIVIKKKKLIKYKMLLKSLMEDFFTGKIRLSIN
jgi:type I restriction enzyme S subunit